MPTKSLVITLLAAALLFGMAISGCNRNRDDRYAMNNRKPAKQSGRRDQRTRESGVRPAEVLSASTRRQAPRGQMPRGPGTADLVQVPYYAQPAYASVPSQYQNHDVYYAQPQASYTVAQAYEPLPEPVPVYGGYQAAPVAYHVPQAQTTYAQPYVYENDLVTIHSSPSPDLAMAKAMLEPMPAQPVFVPSTYQQQPVQYAAPAPVVYQQAIPAPIPELEPVRYHRVAAVPAQPQRAAPVMMSASPARYESRNNRDVQRALAPLPSPAVAEREWVASPNTAMRTGRYF